MDKGNKNSKLINGFTIIEIVIVIGIMAIIFGIVLASISASKNKSTDLEIKKVLSEFALKMESQEIAPGVVDYTASYKAIGGASTFKELVSKYNFLDGNYDIQVLPKSYAFVFKLKKGGYYCIDSASRATGREVAGLFQENPRNPDYPKDCNSATRAPVFGSIPEIALIGSDASYSMSDDCRGNISVRYREQGYTATDVEDGDVTDSVISTPQVYVDPKTGAWQGQMLYDVTDSDGNNASTVVRNLNVSRNQCPGAGGGIESGGGVEESQDENVEVPVFIPSDNSERL